MENYKTAISCDAGNIQINETHIKCEIHAVHKYVGNLSKTFESEFNTFFHEMMISNKYTNTVKKTIALDIITWER